MALYTERQRGRDQQGEFRRGCGSSTGRQTRKILLIDLQMRKIKKKRFQKDFLCMQDI